MPRYVIVETSPAYKNRPERERVYFTKPYEEDDLETATTVAGELQEAADRSGRPEDRYWVAELAEVQPLRRYVVVAFGAAATQCDLSHCPMHAHGPYTEEEAKAAAGAMPEWMRPHILDVRGVDSCLASASAGVPA